MCTAQSVKYIAFKPLQPQSYGGSIGNAIISTYSKAVNVAHAELEPNVYDCIVCSARQTRNSLLCTRRHNTVCKV